MKKKIPFINSAVIFFSVLLTLPHQAKAQHYLSAAVSADAGSANLSIPSSLWGTNLVSNRNDAATTTDNIIFQDSTRWIGPTIYRWPGGNISDHYDWKKRLIIRSGRRNSSDGLINLAEAVVFSRQTGAELSITVNFGTMSAADAADLVEFCNGPSTAPYGAMRDSILSSHGLAPGPLNVRYFEVGNETRQKHMYDHSWTAENAAQYFLGGSAERRGGYRQDANGQQIFLPKGDLIAIRPDDPPGTTFFLRFPPVKNVTIFFIPDSTALADCVLNQNCNFQTFSRVPNFSTAGPADKVFILDSLSGAITFGDNIHGFMPPPGSYLLAEYTTFNHDGFVEFARRMRAASPDFPIKIGATMLPQPGELPTSRWVPADSLKAVFEQMDFLILHHYLPTNDSRTFSYTFRRQTAADRVAEQDSLFNVFRNASTAALGYQKEIGLGVTEWNLFNTNDSLVSRNRSLESAVMGAEWFIRTLNGWTTTPVWIADQFNLAGKNSKFALIETDAPTYRIAPLGMVFAGFRSWRGAHLLSTTVSTPAAPAYSQDVPLIRAAAALSANGDTLLFAMVNNAESDTVSTRLNISNFPYHSVEWRTLNGPDPAANRDGGNSLARESTGFRAATLDSLLLPPHSVTFVKFWQAGVTAIRSQEGNIPDQPILFQNYPNPFNPSTTIRFILTRPGFVRLRVFDLLGREVATLLAERLSAGIHAVVFNAADLPSGVYFYQLQTETFKQSRRLILVR